MSGLAGSYGTGRPAVDAAAAATLLRRRYGIDADPRELGSQQDRNYAVDTPAGTRVLKVFHAATGRARVADQLAAMAAVADAGIDAPRPLPGTDGEFVQHWAASDGTEHLVVLLSFVTGRQLVDAGHLSRAVARSLAGVAGRVCAALGPLRLTGEHGSQWNLQHAIEVVRALAGAVPVQDRASLSEVAESAWAEVAALAGGLPRQPIHGDITDDNVVVPDEADAGVRGVIDFGDLTRSWRVGELAVTLSSMLHHDLDDLGVLADMVAAFDAETGLSDDELRAVWPLVQLRCAVLVVSGWQQLAVDPANDYARTRMAAEQACFEAAARLPAPVMANLLLAGLGRTASGADGGRLLAVPGQPEFPVLSLAADSPALDGGGWAAGEAEAAVLAGALAGRQDVVVVPQGEYRLTRSRPSDRPSLLATFALVAELVAARPFGIEARARLVVAEAGESRLIATLEGGGTVLRILGAGAAAGIVPGTIVEPGQLLALAGLSGGLARAQVQLGTAGAAAPAFCTADVAPGWAPLVRGTNTALGVAEPAASTPEAAARSEQARRNRFLPGNTERYYADPPQIVRGWGAYLVDAGGRVHLDLVNNVAAIGHSHPAVREAVDRALARLNTNSRFLYRVLADYSERLLATTWGGGYDSVLLVNSGTEAMDLALRIAKAATGRRQVITHREGYHGWSAASDAITTSAYDNPHAAGSRPGWVSIAASPNPYRGTHRGAAAAAGYLADVDRLIAGMQASGRPPAAVVMESILGNAGGVVPPAGYFAGLIERVHAAGGVAIADEVQVGFGRTGDSFWAAEAEGALPDLLVCAKAMGNGFPIGAVITRGELSEALAREGLFFSTTAGSPAACAAGIAVLDVIEREDLMAHARVVGAHLRDRMAELAARHPIIGAVHGRGLYQGIELVTDTETLAPAARETALLCEALRYRGVIDQATSERQNVLKVKPPMVLTTRDVDWFTGALDDLLRGWSQDRPTRGKTVPPG
ncbi:aminotransferase class III-fold pyridoxal phosphate-dependent enzyme [Propionicimonas sp.]|uniref:aminotransferase class III-fold pyridoxal phosphate-dependent enzyme n=1 Tax=Propionicimonas sp. TaxID=1955623 RepID=UPI0039E29492